MALDEAENLAKRMVELSIRISGPTSSDTAKALNNLAVVQHETGDSEAAQQNFNAAIEIIEDNEDQLSSRLINPLRGLGAGRGVNHQLEGHKARRTRVVAHEDGFPARRLEPDAPGITHGLPGLPDQESLGGSRLHQLPDVT